jgi:hypothetical protein
MNADDIGRDVIPTRYAGDGREAIDLIRDSMTDREFAMYCHGNALKYRLRAGKKDGEAEDKDRAKASWYAQMRDHVLGGPAAPPDPRSTRPGFVPYARITRESP